MIHAHRFAGICRQKSGTQCNVPDAAARDIQLGQATDIESVSGSLFRENAPPNFRAQRCVGKWKLDDEADPPEKGWVERTLYISGQDSQSPIRLHSLQQVANLDVGVAIMAVFYLAPFAEKSVGFVEKQNRARTFRRAAHWQVPRRPWSSRYR